MKFMVTVVAVFVLLCQLPKNDAACGRLLSSDISESGKHEIVNHHNALRKKIADGSVSGQPKGANLKRMYWDTKLAEDAKKIALTCVFAHVRVQDDRFAVGQNLYTSWSYPTNLKLNYTAAIDDWFNEHKTYKFNSGVYNHYTQVVWANSHLVGCGHTNYYEGNLYRHLFVCNYGPAGNYVGQAPYRTGPGCDDLC